MSRSIRTAAPLLMLLALLVGCGSAQGSQAPTPTATLSTAPEQSTIVPDVTGLPGAEASERLDRAGMTVTFISMADGSELTTVDAAGRPAIRTYPEAGDEVHSNRAVSVFVGAAAPPTKAPVATSAPAAIPDLASDEGLCAADSEMTNLELNDAIAPLLGYPPERDDRNVEQDDAIRAYKNAAFMRACPARAS